MVVVATKDQSCYAVLYYKRAASNKVHRQRGAATMDGILTISGDCVVTLKNADAETAAADADQCDAKDDENTNNSSRWNKKRGVNSLSKISSVYSGTQREIAKRVLNIDDTIVLGGYEVQIVGPIHAGVGTADASKQQSSQATAAPISNHQIYKKSFTTIKKPPSNMLGKRKLPPRSTTVLSSGDIMVAVGGTSMVHKKKSHHMALSSTTTPARQDTVLSESQPPEVTNGLIPSSHSAMPSQRSTIKTVRKVPRIALVSQSHRTAESTVSHKTNDIAMLNPQVVLSHIPLPANVRATLRPHQVIGVEFLWKTLHEKQGCILGDEMGLGKTLMTIATLAALHRQQRHKQFIVVCPSSLIVNWANEFDKWLGKASQPRRVVLRTGGQEGLQQIRAYTSSMKMNLTHHVGQVLIVSYDLFRRNVEEFVFPEHTSIGLLVCDESHRLKSSTGSQTLSALKSLHADARLCITATPIQNNLSEFFNLSNFCCPGILGPDLATFRSAYDRPIAAANQKNATPSTKATGQLKSRELEVISKSFMLRRMQKDILKSMLPPRVEVLLFCRLSPTQTALYHHLTERAMGTWGMTEALQTLNSLRKICCHPKLLQSTKCRRNDGVSGKVVVLATLLQQIRQQAPSDKVVVVSNFTSALTVIEESVLQPNKMEYMRLDGTSKDRQSMVDSFNRSNPEQCFCFLLSSKAGGCGLNLVGANRLVMFDPDWNPSSDIQAMGRVYRQGQNKPCTIYRMFSTGTLEEVIYQRQIQKGGLSNLTVDAGSAAHDAKFSKEEIQDCFTLKEDCPCDTKLKVGKRWSDYSGADSIGCNDPPLLEVARTCKETLSFVHIVEEAEAMDRTESSSPQAATTKNSYFDSSSDEEFELQADVINKKHAESGSSSDDEFEM